MKSTIMHLLSLFLILGFAAACGKKSSSGGSSNSNNSYTATGSAAGQAAYDSLKAWQVGAAEASTVGIHGIYLEKSFSGSFVSIPKMCEKYSSIAFCAEPTGCFKHTNLGIEVGTVVMNNTNILGATLKKYGDCNISNINIYKKQDNQELKDAVLGNATAGKHLIVSLTQKSNSIYTVFYGAFSGSPAATSYSVINTSLPSILNPVEVGSVVNNSKSKSSALLEYLSVN